MRSSRSAGGFTLVEVVIVLVLSSLVMLALTSALRTFGLTGTRLEDRSRASEDMRLVSAFLRQSLEAASARHRTLLEEGVGAPDFGGSHDTLEWLAPMPPRHGVGGLHRFRLSVRKPGPLDARAQPRLVLQFVPFVNGELVADWSAEPDLVLSDGLEAFSIQYLGRGAAKWQDTWDDADLPVALRLRIAAAGGPWPELLVGVLEGRQGVDPAEVRRAGEED